VKPRHEPQIVTNEHRQAMNLIMGSVFITLNLTQNKEQVQKKEQVRKVYRPETWWTHVRRHGGHISIRDNAAPKEEHACLGKRSLSCLSGGKPPFCIDRGHPLHLFGDMVYTFQVIYQGHERSLRYALEGQFSHVATS
jgi:hypothetical protein